MAVPVFAFLVLSLILFGLGLTGILLRRNGLAIVLSVQLLFCGCYLALASFAATHDGGAAAGRISALLAATAAVAQAAVTLSLLANFRQQSQTVDVESADQLKW